MHKSKRIALGSRRNVTHYHKIPGNKEPSVRHPELQAEIERRIAIYTERAANGLPLFPRGGSC